MSAGYDVHQREKLLLAVLLLVFTSLATAYNFSNPLAEASDEESHYAVIRNYQRNGLLQGGRTHESFQPPLYHVIGTAIVVPFNLNDDRPPSRNRDFTAGDPDSAPNMYIHTSAEDWPFAEWVWGWHVLRLYSTLCVTAALWATWKLARQVCPGEPHMALATTGLIAFSPGVLFIASTVNNDNLTLALAALTLWWSARMAQARPSARSDLILGVLLGAGYATKLSLYSLLMPALFVLGFTSWRASDRHGFPHRIFRVGLGFLITSGWWAVHQWRAYGDPFGWQRALAMNLQRDLPLTLAWWWQWAKELWRTYWLKWLHLQQPAAIYLALLLIPLLAMLGWGAIWLRRVPMRQRCVLPLVVMLALQCLTMAAALLIWAMTIRGTDQARLAYPALPAAAALTAMGLTLPWRRTGRPIAITVTVGLAALSIWTLFGIIRPVYAPPDTEPAGPSRPSIVFGGLLGLEYTVTAQEETLRPGDTLLILTRWQALAPVSRDLGLQLKLQPADGDPVVVDFGTPSTGRYATDRWPTGRIIAARHRITVPEGTPPGIYHLIASVRPSREERWLPITQDGKVVGEEVILKTVAVKQ